MCFLEIIKRGWHNGTASACRADLWEFDSPPALFNMKKVFLIHGWGGTGEGGWFDWLKNELKGKARVTGFDMPDTNKPKIENWVGFLERNVKSIDKETYFVGHSIGCQTILRFLEKLPKNVKIGGCAFVAGWFNLKGLEKNEIDIAKPWLETPMNFEKIKMHCNKFLALFSDNDPYVPLSDSKIFKEKLGAKVIVKHNEEHFNAAQEMPEIIDFIGE